ncbi:MAG: tRNA (adenosine(37)-N6)-threonylcarbamoyltransferase complex transferase subunit TsaD [Lentisphaeria bacterium]|nr:tRNA (adenosine(37)-N6)-threonylcarbamoyltransferase complex transferase subunit TsaD [Lentisphaeria bacterium]NQZ68945.1 tRNA (adenosine(37)-N6)-threonylcarbamoyltransferase complex transferase subunit TsaD [Lentisphaeria bacterium]
MIVLGIESSCDETAVSIVEDGHHVRSNIVSSQLAKHAPYGGVIPELAAREHLKSIGPVYEQALSEAQLTRDDIDAVSVTYNPGLLPALLVGLTFAKGLAATLDKPFIGISHFLAHVYGSFIGKQDILENSDSYPMIALVVSGGHTALILINEDGSARIVGQTLDDAAGEAFDKAAKILNLPYPGGPVIDKMSKSGNAQAVHFPRGLCPSPGHNVKPENRLNFSFSGVKTALLYHIKGNSDLSKEIVCPEFSESQLADIVASYQEAIVDALITKTFRACNDYDSKTVVVCGGVACNSRLREKMASAAAAAGLELVIAEPKYCTDNAAMIAGLAYYYLKEGQTSKFDLDAVPRLQAFKSVPFTR